MHILGQFVISDGRIGSDFGSYCYIPLTNEPKRVLSSRTGFFSCCCYSDVRLPILPPQKRSQTPAVSSTSPWLIRDVCTRVKMRHHTRTPFRPFRFRITTGLVYTGSESKRTTNNRQSVNLLSCWFVVLLLVGKHFDRAVKKCWCLIEEATKEKQQSEMDVFHVEYIIRQQ